MKSKVVFTGYYGQHNFGDDIFCQVATWGANKYWKRQARFFVTETPVFPDYFDYFKPSTFKTKGHALLYQYIESIMNRTIVYSGGSIFHSKPSKSYSINNFIYLMSNLGKQLGAIGVSVGPFQSDEDFQWVKRFLSRFSYISVRDRNSFELIKDIRLSGEVVQGFDLAVLYPLIFNFQQTKSANDLSKIIGVSLCHYESYIRGDENMEKQREEAILNYLSDIAIKRKDIIFRFFVLNNHPLVGDQEITNDFVRHLRNYSERIEVINYSYNPKVVVDKMRECKFIIGVRLHSAIMAYTMGIPFLLIEYHPKCTNFLDDINYPKKYRLGSAAVDRFIFSDYIDFFLNQNKSIILEELLPIHMAQELAIKNFIKAPWAIDK